MSKAAKALFWLAVLTLVFAGGAVSAFLLSGAQVRINTNTDIHIGAPTPIFQIFKTEEKPKA